MGGVALRTLMAQAERGSLLGEPGEISVGKSDNLITDVTDNNLGSSAAR
jgi:hypothetical protein